MDEPVATRSPAAASNRRRSRWPLALVAAVAVVLAGVGAFAVARNDGKPSTRPVVLGLPDAALASCLAFDPAYLTDMPLAFEGTATELGEGAVTLEVDHWYKGGDADEALLRAPVASAALIDGIEFEVGQRYLISATEGQVNYCGYSGLATDQLRAGFEQAFGG